MQTEKTERIYVRVSPEQRALLREAADTVGETLTSFLLHDALERARRVVDAHHVTVIRDDLSADFDEWLTGPPRLLPNAKRLLDAEIFEQRQ